MSQYKLNSTFIIKVVIAVIALFIIAPDFAVLRRFVFGFGQFITPSIFVLFFAILQYTLLKNNKFMALVVWMLIFAFILLNIKDGWPTGLMVNVVITLMCLPMTFILALLFAVLRFQSTLLVLKIFATVIIESVRGVPLIGLMIFILSVGADMVPAYWMMPKIITLWMIYSLFAGVYLAEVFRGGFQSIPKAYFDGAYALGMSPLKTYVYVLVPKVVIDTIPAAFNVYIGLFKETSLVLLFGYFDLMNIALNYLDFPEHYDESIKIYMMVLILFWIVATIMHEYGNYLFKTFSEYEAKKT